MREVPKSGPLVLKGGSADPPDPPGYGPEIINPALARCIYGIEIIKP